MASDFVTRWLEERKPAARVTYLGADEDALHLWDLAFAEATHTFRLGIVGAVVDDEGLLAERLMELDTQGWLDQAGEEDTWVLVAPGEVAGGPGVFTGREPQGGSEGEVDAFPGGGREPGTY